MSRGKENEDWGMINETGYSKGIGTKVGKEQMAGEEGDGKFNLIVVYCSLSIIFE